MNVDNTVNIVNNEKVLYDGSQDSLSPNDIIVTESYWIQNGEKHHSYITQVNIYAKVIVIYSITDFRANFTRLIGLWIVSKTLEFDKKYHYRITFGSIDDLLMQECFMYDRFIFVITSQGHRLFCEQPDTITNTRITTDIYNKKEFKEQSLRLFIKSWRRMPFGSKRTYDPTLLECPKIVSVFAIPVPIRLYHKSYCDLIIVTNNMSE